MRSANNGKRLWSAVFSASFMFCMDGVHAQQDYRSKPIRIIVPAVTGAGTDSSTRIVVSRLAAKVLQVAGMKPE